MPILEKMPALGAAIDEESYSFLETHAPGLLEAVAAEVAHGRTPEEIRRFVYQRTNGRNNGALADRCEQAARHLARQNGSRESEDV